MVWSDHVALFFNGWVFKDIIFLPLLVRLLSMLIYGNVMPRVLSEAEREREVYRGYLNGYLAISTAMLIALTIANAQSEIHLNDAVFCAAVSFIFFELALSMQSYKFKLFSAQLVGGMIDVARFSVYLTIIEIFYAVRLTKFSLTMISVLLLAFLMDFTIKTVLNFRVLRGYNELQNKGC